jgi:hypothetical protein
MPDIASRPAALHPLTRRLARLVDAALAQAATRMPDHAAAAALAAQAGLVPLAVPVASRAVLVAPPTGGPAGIRAAAYAVAPVGAATRPGFDRLV